MTTRRGDVKDFRIWLKRQSRKKIPGWAENTARKVFIQLGDAVIEGTPVGDATYWKFPPPKGYTGGRARGSWQPTIGSPAVSDVERIDADGRAPKQEGLSTAQSFDLGEVAYWTSNVPYILRLAHGWSRRQAPNGWVPRAVKQIANQFNRKR